jgi:hypothetical protein
MSGAVAIMGEQKWMQYSSWKFGRKKTTLRLRPRWEDNIKIDLKVTGYESVDWVQLVQDRVQKLALMKTVMNFRVA